jgi:hypothetical protein
LIQQQGKALIVGNRCNRLLKGTGRAVVCSNNCSRLLKEIEREASYG